MLRPLTLTRRAPMLAVAVGLVGLLAAGCNGSTPNAGSSTTTSTVAPSSTTSTSTATSTTVAPTCSTGVLSATAKPGGSAAGTAYVTVTLTNNGPAPCSLEGFPSVSFFGPSGAGGAGAGTKLSVVEQHGQQSPSPVLLAVKGAASFLIVYSDVPAGGVGCVTVASADVVPPGSKESLSFPVSMDLCGGSVRVDPIARPGTETP